MNHETFAHAHDRAGTGLDAAGARRRGHRNLDRDQRRAGVFDGNGAGKLALDGDFRRGIQPLNPFYLGLYGGSAYADSESIAATIGGVAVSNSEALADGVYHGHATSRSYSTALSEFGFATSDSQAVSRGRFAGRATSVSDSFANTRFGRADSQVRVVSGASFYARARSDGVGMSISGPLRQSSAKVHAVSRADRFGRAQSRSTMIRISR